MASSVPEIGPPNHRAIASMPADDILTAREYYIVKLMTSYRAKDADTIKACVEWVVALTSEMRMRSPNIPPRLRI